MCFGSLSCWKVARKFDAKIEWYLELFVIPSNFAKAPAPAEEKQLQIRMQWPPCFTVGMVFFRWYRETKTSAYKKELQLFNVVASILTASLHLFSLRSLFSSIFDRCPNLGVIVMLYLFYHLFITVFITCQYIGSLVFFPPLALCVLLVVQSHKSRCHTNPSRAAVIYFKLITVTSGEGKEEEQEN